MDPEYALAKKRNTLLSLERLSPCASPVDKAGQNEFIQIPSET
jgi:hypothetical protein